ncbi:MAG TPA: K(+)-transporting ATPase subunit F [Burkholderiales bacterium]|nr:K(+)-transporting ATPase subunit F [Burkholderiales bacterium]
MSEETAMSWIYILSGVLALAIMIYLVVALLFPEKF